MPHLKYVILTLCLKLLAAQEALNDILWQALEAQPSPPPDTISVKWLRTKVTCASGGIHLAHLLPSALTPATKGQLRPAQQESKAIT